MRSAMFAAAAFAAVVNGQRIESMPSDSDIFEQWGKWKVQYGKAYKTVEEEATRFKIFSMNARKAAALSMKSRTGPVYGFTKFMDQSKDEFSKVLGYKPNPQRPNRPTKAEFEERMKAEGKWPLQRKGAEPKRGPLRPQVRSGVMAKFLAKRSKHNLKGESADWRGTGALTPVKDQMQCGSCWAFSATEAIESAYYFYSGSTVKLSPQQIVSCDTYDLGCNGGDPSSAYSYVEQQGGLEYESDYPYTSGEGDSGTCKVNTGKLEVDISDSVMISQGADGEDDMIDEIQKSPMSICVDAESWQFYWGGIVDSSTCGTSLDHCVQMVAYDADEGSWTVRNSWNTNWGEDGYIRVKAGENACGVAEEASIVHASDPTSAEL